MADDKLKKEQEKNPFSAVILQKLLQRRKKKDTVTEAVKKATGTSR
jgi:predicted CopG family antitoxin